MSIFEVIAEGAPAYDVLNTVMGFSISEASLPTKVVCPFHTDNTPSLNVYSGDKGTYCFGCGKAYSSYDIVQKHYHYTFMETLDWFEKNYSLELKKLLESEEEIDTSTGNDIDDDIAYYINRIKKLKIKVPKKYKLVSMCIKMAGKGDFSRFDKILEKYE